MASFTMSFDTFLTAMRPISNGTGVVLTFVGLSGRLAPDGVIKFLGVENYDRSWFGLALLFGIGVLLAVQCDKQSSLRTIWQRRQDAEAHRAVLHLLTPDEKTVLVPFIRDQQATLAFQALDNVVTNLKNQGLIKFVGPEVGYGNVYMSAYSLEPDFRDVLTKEPTLLDGAGQRRHSGS